ncbi:PstS family phosphate ABC transporter substrate-binding protein [Mucilaginibacter gotjawali]|uniref:PBP superfamily domain protein n=2 Tax=Mucilaginibacter gotjawali TaxID=1550579 RepID=A0A0X8XAB8_9SPHI|nr:substrate-binding domain-containing protein [Mucilaginibacter gotjawali]MBB3055167.1 phosphate transport system substrate-binding protein [Mucilaginibacter gotjawali]BAU56214.1 PBP superfamily domain protein [Mucilaginibacter gotjawali]
MTRYSLSAGVCLIVLFLLCQSCGHKTNALKKGKYSADSLTMVVDESLQPIVDQELYVFKALETKSRPKVIYAPENDAVNLLLADSVRMALISRELSPQEKQVLKSRNLVTIVNRFAVDAIAIIVNKASNDTTITVSEVKKMLNGQARQDKNIIFDNPNSGLVRYLKAFSGNKELKQKNIFSLKSNKDVIKYVSQHPNSIGIVGFPWLNDPDKDYADAVDNIKIVGVRNDTAKNASPDYFTPSQTTLALKQYPLTRDLYIVNSTGNMSLGMKFEVFMRGERGQLIVLKSGILPDNIPDRQINIVK